MTAIISNTTFEGKPCSRRCVACSKTWRESEVGRYKRRNNTKVYRQNHPEERSKRHKAYRQDHREELNERCKVWYQNNRGRYLTKHYGISLEEFGQTLQKQNSSCAICQERFVKTPCVDHNHDNEKVRGLLCNTCNSGLGSLGTPQKGLDLLSDTEVYLCGGDFPRR